MNLRTTPALLLLSVALCGAGCGQKGPLYLPESGAAAVPVQTVPAQPAAGEAPGPDTTPEEDDAETRTQRPQ